jgi:hypothetical protein
LKNAISAKRKATMWMADTHVGETFVLAVGNSELKYSINSM